MNNQTKIPKTIHYCWFGRNPLPESVVKCIESWKKYCPDYNIIQWNEDNYDITKNKFMLNAYNNKKFAFVSDYVRLDVLYKYGGIYLDTDVEVIKNLDNLLNDDMFFALEAPGVIATGLGMGSVKGEEMLKKNMEFYDNIEIDPNGSFNKIICTKYTSELLANMGMKKINTLQKIENIVIYPTEYFCPMQVGHRKINITPNTYSIHHYDASWYKGNKLIKEFNYRLIPLKKFIKKYILRRT